MSKTLKYVTDFEFPSEFGFKSSAGKTMVKGYARGGSVKGVTVPTVKASKPMDGRGYACGGKVEYAKGGKACGAKAVGKHEAKMHPGKEKTEFFGGGMVKKAIGSMKDKVGRAAASSRGSSGAGLRNDMMQANPGFDTPTGNRPSKGGLLSRVSKLRGIANAQSRAPANAAVQAKPLTRPAGGLSSLMARGKGSMLANKTAADKAPAQAPASPMARKFGRGFSNKAMFGK